MIDEDLLEAWTRKHGDTALSEGWGLFEVGGGAAGLVLEVERDDEAGEFADDDEALAHVEAQAKLGRQHAVEAIWLVTESHK